MVIHKWKSSNFFYSTAQFRLQDISSCQQVRSGWKKRAVAHCERKMQRVKMCFDYREVFETKTKYAATKCNHKKFQTS